MKFSRPLLVGAAALALVTTLGTPAQAAGPTLTAQKIIGGPGHAGLYGWGVGAASDGTVWVGDYLNFRVAHDAADGQYLGDIAKKTKGPAAGRHLSPYGVAVDTSIDPNTSLPRNDIVFGDVDAHGTVDKYDKNGNFLFEFGGPDRFNYPAFVAVDSMRRIWVADARAHYVTANDPNDGHELLRFGVKGTKGSTNTRLNVPRGIAVDANDNVYIVDDQNTRIVVLDKFGKFKTKFGTAGTDPCQLSTGGNLRGIAIDKTTNFAYVVDAGSGYILKYDVQGIVNNTLGANPVTCTLAFGGNTADGANGTFVNGGRGIAVDTAHNVWVGDMPSFRAQKFDPNGNKLNEAPKVPAPPAPGRFAGPTAIGVDGNGYVFVVDTWNQRVEKLDPANNYRQILEFGDRGRDSYSFNYPRGIAIDKRLSVGFVYLADTDNGRVKKFANDGGFRAVAGGLGTPEGVMKVRGLDVGSDGTVYVADFQNGTVKVFDQNLVFQRQFGTKGFDQGEMFLPYGLTVDPADESIWVADSKRGKILHFANNGDFLSEFASLGTGTGQLGQSADIQVNASYVFVTDVKTNQIKIWNKAGVFQSAVGTPCPTTVNKPLGCMVAPQGMDIRNNHLFVVEQAAERAQDWLIS